MTTTVRSDRRPEPASSKKSITARGLLAIAMVVAGLALMAVSYLRWAAPWGFPPDAEFYSNPRVPFAPAIFVLGVILVFSSAVVYELLPDRGKTHDAG